MAKENGYPDPVNDTYEATGEMYQKVVSYLISRDFSYVVVATHNEQAVEKVVEKARKVDEKDVEIVFAQIYGMGEQITMPLGKETTEFCPNINNVMK